MAMTRRAACGGRTPPLRALPVRGRAVKYGIGFASASFLDENAISWYIDQWLNVEIAHRSNLYRSQGREKNVMNGEGMMTENPPETAMSRQPGF
jgi:hypothetical protein